MIEFNKKIQAQFERMCATGKLFRVALTGREIWTIYLSSFINDPKFRDPASSEHNCNQCNSFIRRYGNIVALDANYDIMTIFDVVADNDEYHNSTIECSKAIRNSPIADVFFETYAELNALAYEPQAIQQTVFRLGIAQNHKRYTKEEAEKFGVVKPNETRTFNHMHLNVAKEFIDFSGKSIENIMSDYRASKEVFKRAMDEISLDTLQLVRDLINQGSLLDGTTHLFKIEQFIPYTQEYATLQQHQKDNWAWVKSYKLPLAKFKNELIGVLCSELSEGKEINEAVQAWNKRVDPANYMKVSAPITKKQIEEAKKFVEVIKWSGGGISYSNTFKLNKNNMKVLIKVTKEILEQSKMCGTTIKQLDITKNCAIACAVAEIFPKASVGLSIYIDGTNKGRSIMLPLNAQQFIATFDRSRPWERPLLNPISFEIDVPDEVIDSIGIGQVFKVLSESKTLEYVSPI